MPYFKKLIFAVPFLLSMSLFYQQTDLILKDLSILFSLDLNLLYQLIYFSVIISAASYFFIIFVSLAQDFRIVLPVGLAGALMSLLFIIPPLSFYLTLGVGVSLGTSYILLFNKLTKDPTSFKVSDHIVKSAGGLITLLVLVVTLMVYIDATQSSNQMVQKLINSLVSTSTQFVKSQSLQTGNVQAATTTSTSLTPEQLNLLKQNPGLLKQYGIDPALLNQLEAGGGNVTPQSLAIDAAVPAITKQVEDLIKPYSQFIPFLIAFIFFLNFQFFTSIAALLISPLAYLLFYIMEKTEFIKFEKSTREVKKLAM